MKNLNTSIDQFFSENNVSIGYKEDWGIKNLKSAINRAAELAGLEDFSTYYPAQEINWREQLLERFFSFLPSYIRDNYILKKSVKVLKDIEKFNDPNGVYFICESC